jgi:sulfide:quinone oxidoreductase
MNHVLIAGSGVAALECALALDDLAGSKAAIELLAPASELVHRPSSVTTPFGGPEAARLDIGRVARDLGFQLRRDALEAVQADTKHVITRDGNRVAYDMLVVATGARSRHAVPGALAFRGPASAGAVEQAIARVTADPGLRLAFVAPAGVRWQLPLYELALLSAAALRGRGIAEPDIIVVTGEHEPLEVFGPAASEALRQELREAGVDLITSAAAASALDGAVHLTNGSLLAADIVVALPEIVGPAIPGLPQDPHGFIPVDEHGQVEGCANVFAAGDATAFPVKHGGLAAQQADAVAEAIAARLGAIAVPEPFRPVLRGLLITGRESLYLRTELGPRGRREHRLLPTPGTASRAALWWPPAKVAGRHLTRFVASTPARLEDRELEGAPQGIELIIQAAEEDAAAGNTESAVRALDDAEVWLGPLPTEAAARREAWRQLIDTEQGSPT